MASVKGVPKWLLFKVLNFIYQINLQKVLKWHLTLLGGVPKGQLNKYNMAPN